MIQRSKLYIALALGLGGPLMLVGCSQQSSAPPPPPPPSGDQNPQPGQRPVAMTSGMGNGGKHTGKSSTTGTPLVTHSSPSK